MNFKDVWKDKKEEMDGMQFKKSSSNDRQIAERLMNDDMRIWDKLGIRSRGQLSGNIKLQEQYQTP